MASLDAVMGLVAIHPAWEGKYPVGREGFSGPDWLDLDLIQIGTESLEELRGRGIRVHGLGGNDNLLLLGRKFGQLSVDIDFHGKSKNTVILGSAAVLNGKISFEGHSHIHVFAGSREWCNISATYRNTRTAMFFGRNMSANSIDCTTEGPDRSVVIGDDCMIASHVFVWTHDSHAIFSLNDTTRVLNPSRSVRIQPKVWLGQEVIVGPGVTVGSGSILGARAYASRDIPGCSLAVGSPARVIREDVSWTREAHPPIELLAERAASLRASNKDP